MTDHQPPDGPPRAVLIAAVAVAAAAVVAVLTIAALKQGSPHRKPVAIPSVPAPMAQDPQCQTLLQELPGQLGDYRRADTASPTPPGTAAWQADPNAEPVILRCGVERPDDFVVGSPIQMVDVVQWFRVGEQTDESAAPDAAPNRTTWFAVDRPVYVALTLPPESGPTPIQQISEVIARMLPAKPIDPAEPK